MEPPAGSLRKGPGVNAAEMAYMFTLLTAIGRIFRPNGMPFDLDD
jgi:hypothetical protein